MLESFLGNETFLAGLHLYLQRHQYDNAETSDLWSAMTEQVHQSHCWDYTILASLGDCKVLVLLKM